MDAKIEELTARMEQLEHLSRQNAEGGSSGGQSLQLVKELDEARRVIAELKKTVEDQNAELVALRTVVSKRDVRIEHLLRACDAKDEQLGQAKKA
jgi:ABC-type transporter Mla subunit MlaD